MIFREVKREDIPQIQFVRNSVKENTLSDPNLVTDNDCAEYMFERGKGWVCEIDGTLVGFAIADLVENNIWALFLHPDYEQKGIGRKLHDMMLDWYFEQTTTTVWLSTTPETRAETFYRKSNWNAVGMQGDEIKFEMTKTDWEAYKEKATQLS
ncbi:GNAT family N-acetyltransferase [Flavobacterium sp.]|uniref:GNAT family N-acetyltransferase n=1 Tax=Flavobacterium sp. TaxID=239 RepID=UPI003D13544A